MGNCIDVVFCSQVSPVNAIGTAVALGGVYAYTRVKRAERESAAAKAA